MKNIELKVELGGETDIVDKIKKMGASFHGTLDQKDVYFIVKKGRLKIRSIDNKKWQLIYYERANKKEEKISDYEIVELEKDQAEKLTDVLEKTNGKMVSVSKKRDLWIFGSTRIHLDEVKDLGRFLELETVINGKSEVAKKEYNEVYKKLELKQYKKCAKSYSDLLQGRNKEYYVYILKCADGTLYTGITIDLQRRVLEHNNSDLGAKYTKMRRPVELIFSKKFKSRSMASKEEARIKKLSKKEKLKIIK